MHNQVMRVTNTSGCMGVWYRDDDEMHTASITVEGRTIYLGSFLHFEDAVAARKEAEREFNYHKRHGGPFLAMDVTPEAAWARLVQLSKWARAA
jgi:hypothetical protein